MTSSTKFTHPATKTVRGPYLDELRVGQAFADSPAVTITDGLTSTHKAIVGNRLHLANDHELAAEVTGRAGRVSPAVVWDISIGQSTSVTQHVKANLFYRGLSFRRLPVVGDTLRTITTIEGLKENSPRPGRPPTGLAVLRVVTTDQHRRPVLDFWRCAMLPLSGVHRSAAPADDLSSIGVDAGGDLGVAVDGWDLARFRERISGQHFADLHLGQTWSVQGPDVVTSAPELARLTGNIAAIHHDAASAGGRRLVYGGHTIGLALHQATRAMPAMVTVAGWRSCDHVGPVHEEDALTSRVVVEGLEPLSGGGGLAHVRVTLEATPLGGESKPVLDWAFSAVMA